ncbi:MAG: alpha/beta hydrolase [Pseudomonadota bacterium]|nr:alpha/beta hydrolase [Pseudomonadota bacterium]
MDSGVTHRDLPCNGIRLHAAEQGSGPLVLLCHGWPELWYSWRHQIPALAAAGYHAVAPDMRGFGRSEAPADVHAYSVLHIVGDMAALVAALGARQAVIVGHDWGANIAWTAALLRPDLFRAVAAMSVPFRSRGPTAPLTALRQAGMNRFYWLYFQEPGVAEAEFERDPAATLRRILYSGSGNAPERGDNMPLTLPEGGGFLARTIDPETLPAWLTEQDLALMTAEFARTGFRGGLNYYRNIDRNWELLASWQGAQIQTPALFIAGTRDVVIRTPMGKAWLEAMPASVPHLRRTVLLEGAGHWVQQERPEEVTQALLAFLADVPATPR